MMPEENQYFGELIEGTQEILPTEIASESVNNEDAIVDVEDKEETFTEDVCALEAETSEKNEILPDEKQNEVILTVLKELKEENKELLAAIKEIQNEKIVYEKYQQNLNDFHDTFEMVKEQAPQLITQLRSELKEGPGTDYRKIIEEAAANYKNLKKAIANDMNKAIETWNKVRGGEKEYQKLKQLLIIIVVLQIAITTSLLCNYFVGA